ncbi:MAG TPA: hypothetical protein VFG46_06120 [Chryseolinea sp.]|nr:hypothetical protein [Chryseolinea sp.]
MNNKLLGTIAMAGAPFLGIDFFLNGGGFGGAAYEHTSQTGLFCLIYMSAWMCSIWGLLRANAAGIDKGRYVLITQLIFLTIANSSNVYEIISPETTSTSIFYNVMDMFWPISNLFMIVTGITILRARSFDGSPSFIPLMVGLWIPFSILMYFLIGDMNKIHHIVVGAYSAVAWMLMGYVVRSTPESFLSQKSEGAKIF